MNKDDYIFISAKIRSLEPKILDNIDIERMINESDLFSAFKVLNDTNYCDNLLDAEPTQFRQVLADDLYQLFDFLQKYVPDQNLFKLILLSRDIINIRLCFKERLYGANIEKELKLNTIYDSRRLKDLVFENHINDQESIRSYVNDKKGQILDNEIKQIIDDTFKEIDSKTRPDEIDSILTKKYFEASLKLANSINNTFIIDYYKSSIDVANIMIWLRSKKMNLPKKKMVSKLIKGGNIDIYKIASFYPATEDLQFPLYCTFVPYDVSALKVFINSAFDLKVVQAFENYCTNWNLLEMEKALENYKIEMTKKVKNIPYGPEVVFVYYLTKLTANINTGIILTGKINHISNEEIRKIICEVY